MIAGWTGAEGYTGQPFGGCNIAMIGDLCQLPPIANHLAVYNKPALTSAARDLRPLAAAGIQLWAEKVNVAVVLTKNYRAIGDPDYAEFLDNLRRGVVREAHIDLLKQRRVTASCAPAIGSTMAFHTNSDVNHANHLESIRHGHALGQTIYLLKALLVDCNTKLPIENRCAGYYVGTPRADNRDQLHLSIMHVFIGAKVTLRPGNDRLKQGLSNGCRGVIVGSHPPLELLPHSNEPLSGPGVLGNVAARSLHRPPDELYVYIPGCTIQTPGLPAGVITIKPSKKNNIKVRQQRGRVSSTQFDLRMRYGYTVHKLQGYTEESLYVGCLHTGTPHWVYTALSRVKAWGSLYLAPSSRISRGVLERARMPGLDADMAAKAEIALATKAAFDAALQ